MQARLVVACALAVLATMAVPVGAEARSPGPKVRWDGLPKKAVSGVLQGRRCAVRATRTRRVTFKLDGRVIDVESRRPWRCRFDTRTVANGRHRISAVAVGRGGRRAFARRTLRVHNDAAAAESDASGGIELIEVPGASGAGAPPAPAAEPEQPSGPRPKFFAGQRSVWSTPLPGKAPVRPDNALLQRELVRLKQYGTGVEQRGWTVPTYIVRSDRTLLGPDGQVVERNLPLRKLRMGSAVADPRTGSNDSPKILNFLLQRGIDGGGWPLPNWAKGDPAGEGHFAVYVEDTGQYAELYNAERDGNGDLNGTWGGYVHDLRRHDGTYHDNNVRSLEWSRHTWGPVAASVPTAGGLIWESEIRAAYAAWQRGDHDDAVIPHALGLNVHAHTKNTWVWPANRTDWTQVYGEGGNPLQEGPIEMGQVIRFPDSLDPRSFKRADPKETALLQILVRTGQRHGFVVWDQTGGGFMLRAEQVWTPGGLSTQMFDYGNAKGWMQSLPFEKAEFVETREWMPSHYRP